MWFHYKKIKVCTHTFPLIYKEKQNLDAGGKWRPQLER